LLFENVANETPFLGHTPLTQQSQQTRFASAAKLEITLTLYLKTYNHHIPQRALKHQTPIQAFQK
jgi:hypothetical protein